MKLHSWNTPQRAEEKDPSSYISTREEEEKEWANATFTFASQSGTDCAKPAAEEEKEEEEEGLDLVTYSRLMAIFFDN